MKYLVNRETKEHHFLKEFTAYCADTYKVVEADAEGWIVCSEQSECPLPDDAKVQIRYDNGIETIAYPASKWNWLTDRPFTGGVNRYRPILDKPEDIAKDAGMTASENYENQCRRLGFDPEQECNDIISRLKSAHEAAQSIPDLLAELREALGPELLRMLSDADAEPEIVPPSEWQKGDLIICTNNFDAESGLVKGQLYEIYGADPIESCVLITKDKSPNATLYNYNMRRFRFHSRPEKTK